MTETFIFILGAGIVATALYDFLRTTIALNGLGPFSGALSRMLWRLAKQIVPALERRLGLTLRSAVGPSILVTLIAFWICFHLLGYTLMFRSGRSLIDSTSQDPATLIQTIAFTGSAFSTLGASIVQVTGGGWDMLSMLAAVNGMMVLTLSMSFILKVLQTTLSARTFASRYNALMSQTGGADKVAQIERVAPLGGDLCDVAVKLGASPLPGFFAPHNESMDFAVAICDLCARLKSAGLDAPEGELSPDLCELRWGLGLLGGGGPQRAGQSDLHATMAWAKTHLLD